MAALRYSMCLLFGFTLGCSASAREPNTVASLAGSGIGPPTEASASHTTNAATVDSGYDAAASGWPDASAVNAGENVPPPLAQDAGPVVRSAPERPAAFARPSFCERADGRNDSVRELFCAQPPPLIAGLADLQYAIGLRPSTMLGTVVGGVVLLAHSTALSGELVSAINPRAIITTQGVFLAFTRGVQQVEIALLDRGSEGRFNFYLVDFKQACNAAASGCRPGDLYTPRIESDWLSFTLRDDEELKNTPADCRQCHQRNREKSVLLMRELDGPWTHFFGPDQDDTEGFPEVTGSALMRDYVRAKGDEVYANLQPVIIRSTVGFTLQELVARPQPLVFPGLQIMNERWPYRDGGYPSAPEWSPTWHEAYEAFKRGEQLPMPYFEPRVTDKAKQQKLTAAYQRYASGELAAADLPDLADIFPDDPQIRAEIGLQTEPTATPAQTLIQACGACHNDVLDQTISRARFNTRLSRTSREELDRAIERLSLSSHMPGAMPPPGRRQIAPGQLAPLIEYLKKDQRSAEDDELLDHAARAGMAGPGNTMMGAGL